MRSSSKLLFSNHFQATVVNKDVSIVVKTTILLNMTLLYNGHSRDPCSVVRYTCPVVNSKFYYHTIVQDERYK